MRPLSGSDLAELARYPASLQQTIVALCGVAPSSSERITVPRSHAFNASTGWQKSIKVQGHN